MCILCTARNWCRRLAAMLPWLVIPLVCLWALSGLLLPPRFRIEVTSPRLACVLVLLATLFWYEVIVPHLSIWRARHSARVRERRLSQAMELQKLRKTATRRCRNCFTPYREQNPGGGGRFMCANCGHVSKRPILDIPMVGNEFVGRSGWMCNQDWSVYGCGNWVDGCSTENAVVSAGKVLSCIFSCVWCAWRKAIMIGSSREDGSLDRDNKGVSPRKGENGDNSQESRGEKARRKAEEKRQARLEKEMLEEEERKQREEVARLIEERRKLRDEMLEAEKESLRRSASAGRKDRKGAEKRRLDSCKEKDKGSSKSNSDCEELERRLSTDLEGKHVFDKKSVNEKRVPQKTAALDRTKAPFPLSSRRANKPVNGFDHGQISLNKKNAQYTGHASSKVATQGDDKKNATNLHRLVESDAQLQPAAQKKSWLQLFTRSSAVSPCQDATASNRLNSNSQRGAQSLPISDERMPIKYSLDNHIDSRQSLPFTYFPLNSSVGSNPMLPFFECSRQDLFLDDTDVFEDPCYVPDPVGLLGPVSESLDLGPLFVANNKMGELPLMKKVSAPADVSKPSPIGSSLSGLRASGERHVVPRKLPHCMHGSSLDEVSTPYAPATWQMWGSPENQDGLGVVGRANWLSNLGQNKSSEEDVMHSLLHEPFVSHVAKKNNLHPGTQAPQSIHMAYYQNGGICSPFAQLPDTHGLGFQKTLCHPLPADGDNYPYPLNQMANLALNEVGCDAPNESALSQNSVLSPVDCLSKRYRTSHGRQDVENSLFTGPRVVGQFATKQDVQPEVWSFNQRGLINTMGQAGEEKRVEER